jgi:hypothetical protein
MLGTTPERMPGWATFRRILVETITQPVNEFYPRLGLLIVNAGYAGILIRLTRADSPAIRG